MSAIPWLKSIMNDSFSTITNLSYIIISFLTIQIDVVVSLSYFILGVASTGFHATRNDAWHKFDLVAIFYAIGITAGFLWLGSLGTIIGITIAGIMHYNYGKFESKIGIGWLGIACLVPFIAVNPVYSVYQVVACFLFALILGMIAEKRMEEENPVVYDVLHGVWHIFSALALYILLTGKGPIYPIP